MGFRPTLFTCIAHLYLYYTLLVPHTYASYIKALMYILCLWNTIQSSSISNIVSESLLWPFLAVLSLLVLLHSQHRFRRHNNRHSLSPLNLRCLPAVVLEFRTCSRCCWGVLHRIDYCMCRHRRLYCFDCISRGITKIVFSRSTRWWKPHSH